MIQFYAMCICVQYSIFLPCSYHHHYTFSFFVCLLFTTFYSLSTNNTHRDIFQNYIKSISWQINAYSISLFGAYFLCVFVCTCCVTQTEMIFANWMVFVIETPFRFVPLRETTLQIIVIIALDRLLAATHWCSFIKLEWQ